MPRIFRGFRLAKIQIWRPGNSFRGVNVLLCPKQSRAYPVLYLLSIFNSLSVLGTLSAVWYGSHTDVHFRKIVKRTFLKSRDKSRGRSRGGGFATVPQFVHLCLHSRIFYLLKQQSGFVQLMFRRQQLLLRQVCPRKRGWHVQNISQLFGSKGRNGSKAMVSAAHNCNEMHKMVLTRSGSVLMPSRALCQPSIYWAQPSQIHGVFQCFA